MTVKFKIATSLSLILYASLGFAGGTQLPGQGARPQTMQAFTAVADDPSAVYYNPAGLTQIKKKTVEAEASLLVPLVRYRNTINQTGTNSYRLAPGFGLFAATPTNSDFSFGVGLYAPNARSSDFDTNAAGYFLPMDAYFVRTDLAPSVAFHLTPDVSFGAEVILSQLVCKTNTLGLMENSSGEGVSARFGTLWQATNKLRFGISYMTPEEIHLNGHGYLNGVGGSHYYSDFMFPGILTIGAAYQFTPKFLGAIDIEDEMYSIVKTYTRTFENPIINLYTDTPIHARDSYDFSIGGEYKLTPKDAIRAGFRYQTPALPQTAMIPIATDYYAYMTGLGYSHTFHKLRIDLGTFLIYLPKRVSYQPQFPGPHSLTSNNFLIGLTYQL